MISKQSTNLSKYLDSIDRKMSTFLLSWMFTINKGKTLDPIELIECNIDRIHTWIVSELVDECLEIPMEQDSLGKSWCLSNILLLAVIIIVVVIVIIEDIKAMLWPVVWDNSRQFTLSLIHLLPRHATPEGYDAYL